MDNLINNPYLDRPIQNRFRYNRPTPAAEKNPEHRKAKRKVIKEQEADNDGKNFSTARERRDAED